MKPQRLILPLLLVSASVIVLSACTAMPVGNKSVPQPAKLVDLNHYTGLWYEFGRYENRFEKGCEGVTAEYRPRPDGKIDVINSCHKGSLNGPMKVATGKAKIVEASGDAKLKVSFFGPFYVGDYWVLDHADDYSWSIVGEPSGKYLWLLTRDARPSPDLRSVLEQRTRDLGYDWSLLRQTQH